MTTSSTPTILKSLHQLAPRRACSFTEPLNLAEPSRRLLRRLRPGATHRPETGLGRHQPLATQELFDHAKTSEPYAPTTPATASATTTSKPASSSATAAEPRDAPAASSTPRPRAKAAPTPTTSAAAAKKATATCPTCPSPSSKKPSNAT